MSRRDTVLIAHATLLLVCIGGSLTRVQAKDKQASDLRLEIRCPREKVPAVRQAIEPLGLKISKTSAVDNADGETGKPLGFTVPSEALRPLVEFEQRCRKRRMRIVRIVLFERAVALAVEAASTEDARGLEALLGNSPVLRKWASGTLPLLRPGPATESAGGVRQEFLLAFRPATPTFHRGSRAGSLAEGPLPGALRSAARAVHLETSTATEPAERVIHGRPYWVHGVTSGPATAEQFLKYLFNVNANQAATRSAVYTASWKAEKAVADAKTPPTGRLACEVVEMPRATRK